VSSEQTENEADSGWMARVEIHEMLAIYGDFVGQSDWRRLNCSSHSSLCSIPEAIGCGFPSGHPRVQEPLANEARQPRAHLMTNIYVKLSRTLRSAGLTPTAGSTYRQYIEMEGWSSGHTRTLQSAPAQDAGSRLEFLGYDRSSPRPRPLAFIWRGRELPTGADISIGSEA
jgi:hypothetical protein